MIKIPRITVVRYFIVFILSVGLLCGTQLSYASNDSKTTPSGCPDQTWAEPIPQEPLTSSEVCTSEYIDFWVKFMIYMGIGGDMNSVTDLFAPVVTTTATFTVNPTTKEKLDTLVREWWVSSPSGSKWADVTFDESDSSITIKSKVYSNVSAKLTLDKDGIVFINGVSASYVTTFESPETTVTWSSGTPEAKVCNIETLNASSKVTLKNSLITKKCLQSVSEYIAKKYIRNPFFYNDAYKIINPTKPLTYDNIIPNTAFPDDKEFNSKGDLDFFLNTAGKDYAKYFTYSFKGNVLTVKSKKYSTVKSTLTYKNKKYIVNKKVLTILDLEKFFKILEMPTPISSAK